MMPFQFYIRVACNGSILNDEFVPYYYEKGEVDFKANLDLCWITKQKPYQQQNVRNSTLPLEEQKRDSWIQAANLNSCTQESEMVF